MELLTEKRNKDEEKKNTSTTDMNNNLKWTKN